MKKKNFILILLAIFAIVMFLLSSCKTPEIEFDKAEKAFIEAKKVNANIYTYDEFVSLQDSMNDVTEIIQFKHTRLFKTFKPEIRKLNYIITKSNELKEKCKSKMINYPNNYNYVELSRMTDAQFVAWKYSNITPDDIKKMTVAEFNEWKEAMKYIKK